MGLAMNNESIDGVPLALLKNIEMTWRQASGFSNKANDIIAEGLDQLRDLLATKPQCWPCWSCQAPVTMASRADADGNCPHCEAELDLEDWPVREPAAELLQAQATIAQQAQLISSLRTELTESYRIDAAPAADRQSAAQPVPAVFPGYPPVPEGRKLPAPAAQLANPKTRYVRVPSREDPRYHEEWPEIEGGPVFDGVTYCNHLFEALKRERITLVETLPVEAIDE